jgi:hypothetical protein
MICRSLDHRRKQTAIIEVINTMAIKLNPIGANQTEVELNNGDTLFFSYKTLVAAHISGQGFLKTTEHYSKTTSKHINQWLTRNGATLDKVVNVEQKYLDAICSLVDL